MLDWDKLLLNARPWDSIVWHHSETKDQGTQDWDAIRRYHIKEKGWKDIGYHFGIEKVDNILQVQIGRPLSWEGGHCKGMNQRAIGICVIGNFDLAEPEPELMRLIIRLGKEIMLHIPKITPGSNHYHREFTSEKNCPGLKFGDLSKLRADLAAA